MTKLIIAIGIRLTLALTTLAGLTNVVGGTLPYAGEIRYLMRMDGQYFPYTMDALRGVSLAIQVPTDFVYQQWSPDGQYLAAETYPDIASYLIDAHSGNARLMTEGYAYLQWSPYSDYLVFYVFDWVGNEQEVDLYLANGDGTNLTAIFLDDTDYDYPEFSPDGTQLVYVYAGDLYVMNLTDRSITRLTDTPDQRDMHPHWSPDGQRIAFRWYRDDIISYLSVIDGSGQNRQDFSQSDVTSYVRWSPDSTQLGFFRRVGYVYHLFVADADTGTTRPLHIAYVADRGNYMEWQDNRTLIIGLFGSLGFGNHGFVQDAIDAATGEVLHREPYAMPAYVFSPDEQWTLEYVPGNGFCVVAQSTGAIHHCLGFIGDLNPSFAWLP